MKPNTNDKKERADRTAKAISQGQRWIRLKDKQTGQEVRAQEYYAKQLLCSSSRYVAIDKL